MNDQEFEKVRETVSQLRGQIGARTATEEALCASQRESAKSHLQRLIDKARRNGEDARITAVQLQALFNELPERLSPPADDALEELLLARIVT